MTKEGVRTLNKQVEATTNMTTPTSNKGLCEFIGIVKYYQDMRPKHSHILKSLTRMTPQNVKFKCTDVKQKVLDEAKCLVERNNILNDLEFIKYFEIHTDTRNFQLVLVITREANQSRLYGRKFSRPQMRYTTTEK